MRTKLGYKVVYRTPEGRTISSYVGGKATATYTEGVETLPNKSCGPLCVFSRKRDAQRYLDDIYRFSTRKRFLEIWRCKYEPSTDNCVWDGYSNVLYPPYLLSNGCVLAASVTLLERIAL